MFACCLGVFWKLLEGCGLVEEPRACVVVPGSVERKYFSVNHYWSLMGLVIRSFPDVHGHADVDVDVHAYVDADVDLGVHPALDVDVDVHADVDVDVHAGGP